MASLMYDSFKYDNSTGAIDLDADTFHMLLVTATYAPNAGTHAKRSDVTNEVTGAGYAAGGMALTGVVVTKDTTNHRVTFASDNATWTTATITAAAAVICKWRAGAATADELVCYLDFGGNVSSAAVPFSVICPATGWFYLA